MRRNLIAAREARGLTQAQVAAELDVTDGAVSQWERGDTAPSYGRLFRLARLLGLDPEALLEEDVPEARAAAQPPSEPPSDPPAPGSQAAELKALADRETEILRGAA